jgi:hypothetical protein
VQDLQEVESGGSVRHTGRSRGTQRKVAFWWGQVWRKEIEDAVRFDMASTIVASLCKYIQGPLNF